VIVLDNQSERALSPGMYHRTLNPCRRTPKFGSSALLMIASGLAVARARSAIRRGGRAAGAARNRCGRSLGA
jgi:hypothetical protein